MKKLAWFLMSVCFAIGCASAPAVVPAAKPVAAYGEKIETDSAVLIFPEAIVMYSKSLSYNNRVSQNCKPRFRTTLTLVDKDLSRFENTMMLKCPQPNTTGAATRAFIVSARTDNLSSLPAKFVAAVEVGEPVKMMTVTQFLLVHLADFLESLVHYEFAPCVCPSKNIIEFDPRSSPTGSMVLLLADRLATTRLQDGSRYLKYDEVMAVWEVTRRLAEFRAGCLSDAEIDDVFNDFRMLLNRLYPTQ